MTARKLPLLGLRDRTGGEEGAGPATAERRWGGPPSWIENGCGEQGDVQYQQHQHYHQHQQRQARCSNSSSQAGLPSSIMQPLPLASRYVGAPKDDTLRPTSSALGSSWIRRFLPTTGGDPGAELGKDVTLRASNPAGGRRAAVIAGGAGVEPGSQPAGLLLLAAAPNQPHDEQQQQQREGGTGRARMEVDSFVETSGKVFRIGESMQKGKASLEMGREGREFRQETTTTGMHESMEVGGTESLRKVNTRPPSHAGSLLTLYGSSRPQQHEGNHRPVSSTRAEFQASGTGRGSRVTGFGPFQVFKKSPVSDYGKTAGVLGNLRLKGMEAEARVEVDGRPVAQPDAHRFSTDASDTVDCKPTGMSAIASETGTNFNSLLKSKVWEDPSPGRPSGAWGFPRSTKGEDVEPMVSAAAAAHGDGVGSSSSRPPMVQLEGGQRETADTVGAASVGLKASESLCKSDLEWGPRQYVDAEEPIYRKLGISSGRKFKGEGFVSSYPPAATNLGGTKEEGGQAPESKFLSPAAENASAIRNDTAAAGAAGFPTGLENRPPMIQLEGGQRETADTVGAAGVGLKGSESSGQVNLLGEGSCKSDSEWGPRQYVDAEEPIYRKLGISSGRKFKGEGFVSSYPPAATNLGGTKEEGGQAPESKFLSPAAENASAIRNDAAAAGAAGFPTGLENRPPMIQLEGGQRETADTVGAAGVGLKGSESPGQVNLLGEGSCKSDSEWGPRQYVDGEEPIYRKLGISSGRKFKGEGFVSSYPPAATNLGGTKEEGGQATESKFLSPAAENASAIPNNAAAVGAAGFPTGLENRKLKGVVGFGFPSGRHKETEPFEYQQHSQDIPSHALHLSRGDFFTGKFGLPLPFSLHSSFNGEDNSGDGTKNSRRRVDRPESPLTALFDSAKLYEGGLQDDQPQQPPSPQQKQQQSEQEAPWTSLYASFKGLKHAEVANSSFPRPALPLDVHSRLQDGSVPANRPLEGLHTNVDRNEASGDGRRGGAGGGRGRGDAHFRASPEARSRFDNQSSHFSSSPWPDEEGHIPNDDTGSGPYNSQPTGSAYHSQVNRVANRNAGDSIGRHMSSTFMSDTGGGCGATEGLDKAERSRQSSASEPDLKKYAAGSQREEGGQQMTNQGKQQAQVPSIPLKYSHAQAISGYKNDTSDSSPPSFPLDYNSSDFDALPRGIIDQHLLSIACKLKNVEVDSELEGSRVPRMLRKGNRRDEEEAGFAPKRTNESMNVSKYDNKAAFREHKELHAFLSRVPDLQRAQPPVTNINPEGTNRLGKSNEGIVPGRRHGKVRTSGEAMGEGSVSGPSKRTRLHVNLGSHDLGSRMAGSGTMPSSWLTRWMPPSSTGNAAKSPADVARPKNDPTNVLRHELSRSNKNNNFMGFSNDLSAQARIAEVAKGKVIEKGSETKARYGLKGLSIKGGLLGLPPHPVPSAAAVALVGTAARKMGSFPQQRRGSVAMWPPVHLRTAQAPEGGQQSS